MTYREALNRALREEMQRDEDVFLIGEEVGEYDGAYKVSKGLLDEFGEWRVRDMPIAENGFAGLGIGAAMTGLRPIVEFMTWNFALLAYDAIVNSAAKMLYMSGGQYNIPIVFRGPGGSALQLSAQHSQVPDPWYANIPGLKVCAPGTPADALGLLKSAVRDNDPVVFIEGELLYNLKGEVPVEEHIVPIGVADIKRAGDDVTIVAHAKMLQVAQKAAETLAEEHEVEAEIVDLRTLRPLDIDTIVASVKKTGRAVVVQEGWPYSGIGAQVVDDIQREAFDYLDAPIARVSNLDVPMHYARPVEKLIVPSPERVVNAVKHVCYLD
ncbi:MAG: pyruvate dehydrogenase complex E1 component subunit beta [Gemmatimonadota bacterium]|jgi:pyruvate dehydrogenase E1 component beta subunit